MNKYKKLLTLLLILLGLGLGYFYLNKPQITQTPPEAVEKLESTLTVKVEDSLESYDLTQFVGNSALAATLGVTKVETSGKDENAFVTSINGRAADTKKREFWELLVNGKSSEVGAGSYIIQNGDKIEWQISTY